MARWSFPGFSVEAPEGWLDTSTIMFTAPPTRVEGLPLLQRVGDALQPNVVLRREPHGGGAEVLPQLAAHQEQELCSLPGTRVLDRFELPLAPAGAEVTAVGREFAISAGGGVPVRQLHLYFVAGGFVYVLVGTAPQSAAYRDVFLNVARSLRIEG